MRFNKLVPVLSVVFLLAGILSFGAISAAEDVVIVSVNLDEIAEVHPAFHKAQEQFMEEVQEMQEELAEMDEDEAMLAREQMDMELEQKAMEYQQQAMQEIRDDVEEIAEELGYDYIVVEGMLLAGEAQEDVTEEILEIIEEDYS